MGVLWYQILVLVFISCCFSVVLTLSSDSFDGVFGDMAPCHKGCRMTYSLHTYPKDEELYACQRGCRLFSICQFVDEWNDLNQTKLECQSACAEAYTNPDEQYACNIGCQNQLPLAEERREQLLSMMPRIHLLYPLTLVRAMWSDMMNSAQSFITASWTFYFQADDGKIVVFQVNHPPFYESTELDSESEPQIQYVPQSKAENSKEPSKNLISFEQIPDSPFDYNSQSDFLQSSGIGLYRSEGQSLLKCLTSSNWYTKWILTTTLVLSVLVLIWICCATFATATEKYLPSEKLSIYGDLEYMNEKKLHAYPPASLVVITSKSCGEEEEEAAPLPTKVDLTKTDI